MSKNKNWLAKKHADTEYISLAEYKLDMLYYSKDNSVIDLAMRIAAEHYYDHDALMHPHDAVLAAKQALFG